MTQTTYTSPNRNKVYTIVTSVSERGNWDDCEHDDCMDADDYDRRRYERDGWNESRYDSQRY